MVKLFFKKIHKIDMSIFKLNVVKQMLGGFRKLYSDGVDKYYKSITNYSNPHQSNISDSIPKILSLIKLSDKPILDFCAGSGEVSEALKLATFNRIIGSDPYTYTLYHHRTGLYVYPWSFDDVMNCCLEGFEFSLVICSYALHLCPKSKLKLVTLEISKVSPYLCIISPHKKVILVEEMGWKLVNSFKNKKTRVWIYQSNIFDDMVMLKKMT